MAFDPILQFAFSIAIALLGAGVQMTGSKPLGVVLTMGSLGWMWWLLLPLLPTALITPQSHLFWLIGVWLLLTAIGIVWIRNIGNPHSPQSSPPTLMFETKTQPLPNYTQEPHVRVVEKPRPRLVVTPTTISRRIPLDLQPPSSSDSTRQETLSYFALLRVANEPVSNHTDATAYDLYASVSFYTNDWAHLLLTTEPAWISLAHTSGNPDHIGDLSAQADPLKPYGPARYLGLAIAESFHPVGKEKEGDLLCCTALTFASRSFDRWINMEHYLYGLERREEYLFDADEAEDDEQSQERPLDLRVRVTIGCKGFQTTSHFALEDFGEGEGFSLLTTPPPSSISLNTQ